MEWSDFARKGGQAKFKKYGVEGYREMARKATEVRKQKAKERKLAKTSEKFWKTTIDPIGN